MLSWACWLSLGLSFLHLLNSGLRVPYLTPQRCKRPTLRGLEARSMTDKVNVCAKVCRLGKGSFVIDPAPSEVVPEVLQRRVKVLPGT